MTILGLSLHQWKDYAPVFISILALISSIVFSLLQRQHNKNSVRPIAAILKSDYEDRIRVSIQNVGTGPLTIIKLWCQDDDSVDKHPTLIEMMPNISLSWTSWIENCDGRTLPVGGKIELVSLVPQNETDRRMVRKALSTITVYVDYKDIYNQKFHEEQKLDFFGRHFGEKKLNNYKSLAASKDEAFVEKKMKEKK